MKPQTVEMSWPYIAGLIETDGSFQVTLESNKSANVKAMVKISQKTNSNLLSQIQSFLKQHGINSGIQVDELDETDRAPAIRVQGRNQVKKLIQYLEDNTSIQLNDKRVVFASAKQRDFLITKTFCERDDLSPAEKIDLLKSIRKSSKDEKDLSTINSKSRNEYEATYNLLPGSSVNAAKSILQEIDQMYFEGVNRIKKEMEASTLKVDGRYITGLIDGDGSYCITFDFKQAKPPKFPNPTVGWQGNLTMTMESNALLTLEVVLHYFQIKNVKPKASSRNTSYQMWIRTQTEMLRIIKHHETYPLPGEYRRTQFELVKKLFELRAAGKLRDYKVVEDFLKEVYFVSEMSSKGPARRPLVETLEKLKLWLNRN